MFETSMPADEAAEALRRFVSFHAALHGAFQAFVSELKARCEGLVRHQLDAATSEFADPGLLFEDEDEGTSAEEIEDDGNFIVRQSSRQAAEEEAEVQLGEEVAEGENAMPGNTVPATTARALRPPMGAFGTQMTVPETPSPDVPSAGKVEIPLGRRVHALAMARNIDAASPAKGRRSKLARLGDATGTAAAVDAKVRAGGAAGGYVAVCSQAERAFGRIKRAVADRWAPAALRAAFLEPVQASLATRLCVGVAGAPDAAFMDLFAGGAALAGMEAERDGLARRAEGLAKMQEEFGELARAL
jgi:hypothetical protein